MKKPYIFFLLLLLPAWLIAHQEIEEELQEIAYLHNLMGMSVVTVHEGKILYSGHFGLSNHAMDMPVTQQTLYRVASISKTFTAMAFMQLYQQGLVGLR